MWRMGRYNRIIVLLLLAVSLTLTACAQPAGTGEPVQGAGTGAQIQNQAQAPAEEPSNEPAGEPKKMPEEALYVCQYTTNQVAVIDLATGETVREIPVGAKPIALLQSPDGHYVYVANSGSGDVYRISTVSGEIEARIAMGNQPVAMAINSAGDRLYVLDYYLNRVSSVDLKIRSMVGFYPLNTCGFEERMEPPDCCHDIFGEPLGAGRKPSAIVLDEAENKIYVGNMGTWDIAVIDLQEGKEVEAYDAAFGINEMIFAGSASRLYISAAGNELDINDAILSMDLKGGGKTDKVKVGEKPVSIASSPDGTILYVVTEKEAKLVGLDTETGQVTGQCLLSGQPGDLALSKAGDKAYIANLLEGTVFVVDTRDYEILETLQAGVTPRALVYSDHRQF
ncbi:40-residue YVTN family beta-propeller repeat protein [Desulfitobacterium hafniense DCB-2]|uniref:40-residue YVTN family beta-propeller repeat protein n=2 Tax=Desulfitobacterium hafniense TaxID=49338 RepID=B8FQ29_DESHD|nr:40-residue YVTN family beta-propeller repeat protein [Desulfitobacterium hafniense DCB-2]